MSVISATSYTSRVLVDGTLAMVIHIEPAQRDTAMRLFGAPGTEMGVAPLVPQHKRAPEPEPAPMRGGEIARWIGIRCGEPEFQAWAGDRWPTAWQNAIGKTPAQRAGSVIRAACSVESRREFDNDSAAERRFHDRIRKPWEAHQQSRGHE